MTDATHTHISPTHTTCKQYEKQDLERAWIHQILPFVVCTYLRTMLYYCKLLPRGRIWDVSNMTANNKTCRTNAKLNFQQISVEIKIESSKNLCRIIVSPQWNITVKSNFISLLSIFTPWQPPCDYYHAARHVGRA